MAKILLPFVFASPFLLVLLLLCVSLSCSYTSLSSYASFLSLAYSIASCMLNFSCLRCCFIIFHQIRLLNSLLYNPSAKIVFNQLSMLSILVSGNSVVIIWIKLFPYSLIVSLSNCFRSPIVL